MIAWILVLGAVGVYARYGLGGLNSTSFPIGTLLANLVGCLLIGWVAGTRLLPNQELKVAVMIGLLGGLTTFSGFALEAVRLFESGRYWIALSYILGTNLVGFGFVLLGKKLSYIS